MVKKMGDHPKNFFKKIPFQNQILSKFSGMWHLSGRVYGFRGEKYLLLLYLSTSVNNSAAELWLVNGARL